MTNGQNGQNGQKKKLETQLWNIADSLRGKMNADEFRDYCLGFIFYKYLSERQYLFANGILAEDKIDFLGLDESSAEGQEYLEAIKEESDDRFSQYGRLAPSSKADFAFVQHMLHQLDENGTMAVVLPHGVLFRGAAEGQIRKYLINERNWLDAVIGLPANIFYGTSIPTCVLVFKKCREQPQDILFIDASASFEKAKNQNFLRDMDVDKIVATYRDRLQEDKYSYCAPLSEVAENDFNLNIPRYVDTFEEEEEIDLGAIALELKSMDQAMEENDRVIRGFCEELGIDAPL